MRVAINSVTIAGNLTRHPSVKYTGSGKAVTTLSVAVNEMAGRGENKREIVTYVDVTVWDKAAEACGQYLDKGSPVLVEGRLKLDTWEKNGEKRSKLGVSAFKVHFLGSPEESRPQPEDEEQRAPDYESESQAPDGDDDSGLPF